MPGLLKPSGKPDDDPKLPPLPVSIDELDSSEPAPAPVEKPKKGFFSGLFGKKDKGEPEPSKPDLPDPTAGALLPDLPPPPTAVKSDEEKETKRQELEQTLVNIADKRAEGQRDEPATLPELPILPPPGGGTPSLPPLAPLGGDAPKPESPNLPKPATDAPSLLALPTPSGSGGGLPPLPMMPSAPAGESHKPSLPPLPGSGGDKPAPPSLPPTPGGPPALPPLPGSASLEDEANQQTLDDEKGV